VYFGTWVPVVSDEAGVSIFMGEVTAALAMTRNTRPIIITELGTSNLI
jgi:hypothetical protein